MIAYIDSSCAVALLKEEHSSERLRAYVDDWLDDGHHVAAGMLIETEVQRVAGRFGIDAAQIPKALSFVSILSHVDADFRLAGRLPGRNLGSLDALHLATAIRAGVDAMFTDDQRLAEAAEQAGIPVLDTSVPRTARG